MTRRPKIVDSIIATFARLPGIGLKSAERIVFFLLKQPPKSVDQFAALLQALPKSIVRCGRCGTFDTKSPCPLCADRTRDQGTICVVAEPSDITAIEKTGQYHGLYHVLHGLLNPIEGVTPDALAIAPLLNRLKNETVTKEVILALNQNVEGEATSLFLRKSLRPYPVRVSKLARGLPVGGELEYADEITLGDAIKGRQTLP